MIRKQLNGGINLTYLPGDKFKTVHIKLNIYRPMGQEATMNALLTRVLKSGCKKYNNKQALSRQLDSLYGAALSGETIKMGDVQLMSFSISLPGDRYTGGEITKQAAKLLSEVVFCPDITEDSFKKSTILVEKNNLKKSIDAIFNDKKILAENRCVETMFPDSPFAISEMGNVKDLEDIDEKNLKDHYDKIIKSSKIDVYVSGDCNIDEITEVFENVYSAGDVPLNKIECARSEIKTVIESQDVTQGKLMMGFKTDIDPASDDYYKILVFASVYGSGTHSKLFCNVREKLSLAYYAYARLNKYKSFIMVGSGIQVENYNKAKDEILLQFNEIKNGNVTDFELSSTKKSLISSYRSMEDEPSRIITLQMGNSLLGLNISIDEIIQKISDVTKDDVVKMAERVWLDSIYFLKGKDDE